jgi:hypothetical protein
MTDTPTTPPPAWVRLCRHTNDPKLAWIERTLAARGIPSRRNGESFHAPILEVPQVHEDAAWDLLAEPLNGKTVDDVADDDPIFEVSR